MEPCKFKQVQYNSKAKKEQKAKKAEDTAKSLSQNKSEPEEESSFGVISLQRKAFCKDLIQGLRESELKQKGCPFFVRNFIKASLSYF